MICSAIQPASAPRLGIVLAIMVAGGGILSPSARAFRESPNLPVADVQDVRPPTPEIFTPPIAHLLDRLFPLSATTPWWSAFPDGRAYDWIDSRCWRDADLTLEWLIPFRAVVFPLEQTWTTYHLMGYAVGFERLPHNGQLDRQLAFGQAPPPAWSPPMGPAEWFQSPQGKRFIHVVVALAIVVIGALVFGWYILPFRRRTQASSPRKSHSNRKHPSHEQTASYRPKKTKIKLRD